MMCDRSAPAVTTCSEEAPLSSLCQSCCEEEVLEQTSHLEDHDSDDNISHHSSDHHEDDDEDDDHDSNNNNNNNNNSDHHCQKDLRQRQSWLNRSLSKRTMSFVESHLEQHFESCHFLQNHEISKDIAVLKRSDVKIGRMLDKGGFSKVFTVRSIVIDDDDDDTEDEDENDNFNNGKRSSRQVRKALNAQANQLVLKQLRTDLSTKRHLQAAADSVVEAHFLARLQHPHMIALKGWTSIQSFQDNSYFMLLEKIDETLSRRLDAWREDYGTSNPKIHHYTLRLTFAQQLASVLSYMHSQNIIYRDLKPDNIGIKGNSSVKLFDLGLARELPEQQMKDSYYQLSGVGTRRYMAPEVALGLGYNLQADVYSFGIVLWEMMSLQKPFQLYNRDMHQLLVCEEGQRPSLVEEWPVDLKTLMEDTWQADPAQRPTSTDVYETLSKMVGKQPSRRGFWKSMFPLRSKFHKKGGNEKALTTSNPRRRVDTEETVTTFASTSEEAM